MTIRTNRNQIVFGIDFIFFTNSRNRVNVMDMNKTFSDFTKYFFKIEVAYLTRISMMF